MRPQSLHAVRCFMPVYLHLHAQTAVHMHLMNQSWLYWLQEYLQLEPHTGIKQFLGSPVYICDMDPKVGMQVYQFQTMYPQWAIPEISCTPKKSWDYPKRYLFFDGNSFPK